MTEVEEVCYKQPFANRQDAKKAATRRRRSKSALGGPQRPYKCPMCGSWHLASAKSPKMPRRSR